MYESMFKTSKHYMEHDLRREKAIVPHFTIRVPKTKCLTLAGAKNIRAHVPVLSGTQILPQQSIWTVLTLSIAFIQLRRGLCIVADRFACVPDCNVEDDVDRV